VVKFKVGNMYELFFCFVARERERERESGKENGFLFSHVLACS
jgi:hypothetical protein